MDHDQSPSYSQYASVIVELAIEKTLDYGVPEALRRQVEPGLQVSVPLRGSLRKGVILALKEQPSYPRVAPLEAILSERPLLPPDLLALAEWMKRYYCAPFHSILKTLIPSGVRDATEQKKQLWIFRAISKEEMRQYCIEIRETHPQQARVLELLLQTTKAILLTELLERAEVSRSPVETLVKQGKLSCLALKLDESPLEGEEYFRSSPKKLSPEQKQALDKVEEALSATRFETHLLYGITGSGKTEVYLQAIQKALLLGRGAIVLVPEIALTMQTIERFRTRFDVEIAVLHHRLSAGERHLLWQRIYKGEIPIVLGARSALFSPMPNLGLIIIDEEHENAYKQTDEAPCYHARDVAVMRGQLTKSVVLLGSATPSLESYTNVKRGKYLLSPLTRRLESAQLPSVTLVDMRREYAQAGGFVLFSQRVVEGIKERVGRGEQVLLFLNRRGYHTSLSCKECGHTFQCPRCDCALVFHQLENRLSCHLCNHTLHPTPKHCPHCKHGEMLKFRGVGTELVEKSLRALLPEVRTLRVDGDTTRHKGSHEALFRAFSTGKSDVLIGTQMIAKGLHFPSVTLTVILNSDGALQIPDFRSSEQVFQLITQMAGRSGRGALSGEVVIQTSMPEHPVIQQAAKQDYEAFYAQEIESRRALLYPPFTHFAKLTFKGKEAEAIQQYGERFRLALTHSLSADYGIYPLLPSGYPKINEIYRFQLLIRGRAVYPLGEALEALLAKEPLPRGIRLTIDIDPTSTFF